MLVSKVRGRAGRPLALFVPAFLPIGGLLPLE